MAKKTNKPEGVMMVFRTNGTNETKLLDSVPDLHTIREWLDGGYLEAVPHFTTINPDKGPLRKCVAFVDEEGKLAHKHLPPNAVATKFWEESLNRLGVSLYENGQMLDFLVGPCVVIWGNEPLMRKL
jgi:hypothetical protein